MPLITGNIDDSGRDPNTGGPITLHQPITFRDSECSPGDCQRIIIGNNEVCPGFDNPYFTGNPVDDWILSAGLTQVADPLQVTAATSVTTRTIATTGVFPEGEYTVTLDIDNNSINDLNVAVSGANGTSTFLNPQFIISGVGNQRATANVTLVGPDAWTITIGLRYQSGPNLDATLNYISICPVNLNSTSYCFQLPLFQTGDELLSVVDSEVNFVKETTLAAGYNETDDLTTVPCGAPSNNNYQTVDPSPLDVNGVGQYFTELQMGDITIDYGLNYLNDTVGQMVVSIRDATLVREDEYAISESDANTDILFLGTSNWLANDIPSLWLKARTECDGTDEHIKFDVDIDEYSLIPSFYEKTFSATDDTYYRLTFDLDKTTSVRVTIDDSLGNPKLDVQEYGPSFNKIFNTGTLAAGSPDTLTVRFEIPDLTEYPNTDYGVAVLSNVQLYEMCKWDVSIETTDEVFDSNLTETHATTNELSPTVSYNKNIQYCIDTSTLSDTLCYQFRAVSSCDALIFYTSNCVKVCKTSCTLDRLSWDHDNIKFTGNYIIDNLNYDFEYYVYVQIDFQDLTHEWEGVIYRDAAMFLQNPYSFFANTKVMQIWPLPGFARRAIAMALTDIFEVNGVSYRKLDDEAIVPGFNAVEEAPLRILVQEVGDFVESKNV